MVSFSKIHWTAKIIIVYLIKNSCLFYFLPKKWWSCDCFFFPASEAPKNFWGPRKRFNFWILDLEVSLKKLGIWSDLYEKSVLYLFSNLVWDRFKLVQIGINLVQNCYKLVRNCFNSQFSRDSCRKSFFQQNEWSKRIKSGLFLKTCPNLSSLVWNRSNLFKLV